MRSFQRYTFWVIGWVAFASGFYQIYTSIKIAIGQMKSFTTGEPFQWMEWIFQTVAYSISTFAIALICMFFARICTLEEDKRFKSSLDEVVKKLRGAGDLTAVEGCNPAQKKEP